MRARIGKTWPMHVPSSISLDSSLTDIFLNESMESYHCLKLEFIERGGEGEARRRIGAENDVTNAAA